MHGVITQKDGARTENYTGSSSRENCRAKARIHGWGAASTFWVFKMEKGKNERSFALVVPQRWYQSVWSRVGTARPGLYLGKFYRSILQLIVREISCLESQS